MTTSSSAEANSEEHLHQRKKIGNSRPLVGFAHQVLSAEFLYSEALSSLKSFYA